MLTVQGLNFESQLVKELCKLAQIPKVQMTAYHPETNGQWERFNQTLISMMSMLETKYKHHWKDYLPMLVHACNNTKNNATDFSPYYLMYRCKPQLPIDIWFGLTSPQSEEWSHNEFITKLSAQLWWCYELANQHQHKKSNHQKWWCDWKMRASRLEPSDLCLVWQKAFGGKHEDRGWLGKHKKVVIEWQLNIPVYTIKPWQGVGRTQVVHWNLLMHIVPLHWGDEIQSETKDSEYITPPGDKKSPGSMRSTIGPVTRSQTQAHQLAQSMQDTWTKAVQYVQHK